MLRKGRFAVVGGKEYGLFSCHHQSYLKSTNILDLANGFVSWYGRKGIFVKRVSVSELENAYEVFPYVMLRSHRFVVEEVDCRTGRVLLVTSNPFVQKKVNVKPYGIGEYMIELPIEEVAIEEERIAILGFKNNYPLSHEYISKINK